MTELDTYMEMHRDVDCRPHTGWATARGDLNTCTCLIVQSETLQGYKLAARLKEALAELGEPYIISDGVSTMHLWVRPGIWEVFESYYKPGAFLFAGLSLAEYMRAMLR